MWSIALAISYNDPLAPLYHEHACAISFLFLFLVLKLAPSLHPQHPIFKPFMFFDLTTGEQERRAGGSLSNTPEAGLAVNIYMTLKRAFGAPGPKGSGDEYGIPRRVGVITPYARQVQELKRKFQVNFSLGMFLVCKEFSPDRGRCSWHPVSRGGTRRHSMRCVCSVWWGQGYLVSVRVTTMSAFLSKLGDHCSSSTWWSIDAIAGRLTSWRVRGPDGCHCGTGSTGAHLAGGGRSKHGGRFPGPRKRCDHRVNGARGRLPRDRILGGRAPYERGPHTGASRAIRRGIGEGSVGQSEVGRAYRACEEPERAGEGP